MPKRYKEARLMHKAKLTEMATKLGVSQPTLSAWESERKSAPALLQIMCKVQNTV